jgi:hypothetical protein
MVEPRSGSAVVADLIASRGDDVHGGGQFVFRSRPAERLQERPLGRMKRR